MPRSNEFTLCTTLTVGYNANGCSPQQLTDLLGQLVQRAAGDGDLTGDTPAEVTDYRWETQQHEVVAHDAIRDWLTSRVESGGLNIEQLIAMVIDCGAMSASSFYETMRERMPSYGVQLEDGLICEDDFIEVFGARAQDSGDLFEFEQVKHLPLNTVWTIVTSDECDSWIARPGFGIVNRLGYVVSERPWTDPDLFAYWFKDDLDKDEDEDEDEHSQLATSA